MANRQDFIDLFINSPDDLMAELNRIPRSIWDFKPSSNVWSINEIIYHIVESEAHNYIIFRTAIAEPGKTVMIYDEDKWLKELNTPAVSIDDLLDLLLIMRRINASLLRSLSDDKWRNTINYPDSGMKDLDTWLAYRAKHIPDHISQIKRRHRDWLEYQKTLNNS